MKTAIATTIVCIVLAMFWLGATAASGAICVESGTVVVSWNPNPEPDVAGYNVFHSFVGGTWNHIATTADTYITVSELPEGEHIFALTAVDFCNNVSDPSEPSEPVTKDTIAPSKVTGLTVSVVAE